MMQLLFQKLTIRRQDKQVDQQNEADDHAASAGHHLAAA